uniref:Uncharacterized protein n=1 Tax=Arundo donax TaxID=35708 RepID=A0A0A9AMH5_ARUDO
MFLHSVSKLSMQFNDKFSREDDNHTIGRSLILLQLDIMSSLEH